MATEGGFVYVLSNECMPGIVKIGRTKKLPEDRSREIYQTGVPVPFTVEFAIYSENPARLESDVHDWLSDERVNKSREFFEVSVRDAIRGVLCFYLFPMSMRICGPVGMKIATTVFDKSACCGIPEENMGDAVAFITDSAWKAAAAKYIEFNSLEDPSELDDEEVSNGTDA